MNTKIQEFLEKVGNRAFYVMDTETTGFTPVRADVIEISAVKVRNRGGNLVVEDTFDRYINPHYPLPASIVEFNEKNGTGICDQLLQKSPDAKEVVRDLNTFFDEDKKNLCVVGHNLIKFDVPFIKELYEKAGDTFVPTLIFDTLLYARGVEFGSCKLCDLHQKTNQTFTKGSKQYHNSISDCLATLDVFHHYKGQELGAEKKKPTMNFDLW